jgi:hypothetical protein
VRAAGADNFAPAAATFEKVNDLVLDFFTVTFAVTVPADAHFVVVGDRLHERSAGITKGTQLDQTALEKELSKQGVVLEELRRDFERSLSMDFGEQRMVIARGLENGQTIIKNGDAFVPGPFADEVENAQEYAEAAAVAEAAAELAAEAAIAASIALINSSGSLKPLSFFGIQGVEQGITVDKRAALEDACESGYKVDGRFLTLNIDGNMRPNALKGLRDIILRQLTPDVDARRTLDLRDLSGFELDNIVVDGGSVYTQSGVSSYLSNNGMAFLYQCSDFSVRNYGAKNGGPGNGIVLEACTDWQLQNINVKDLFYDIPVEVNDMIDGILINGCARGVLNGFRIRNLSGTVGGIANRRWNRGVAVGNNTNLTIANGSITITDVGLDMTGSTGNESVAIDNMTIDDQYTWGYKFANAQRKIVGRNLSSRYAGLSSFVFSAPVAGGTSLSIVTQDIELDGIIGYNPGATTDVLTEGSGNIVRNGVTIMPASAEYTLYPQGIRIRNALMMDDRGGSAKMKYGYRNAQVHPGTVGFKRNEIDNSCKSQGHITARQNGFHYARCVPSSSDTGASIANGTFTDVGWNQELEDSSNMHSTSSNVEQVSIFEDGWYELEANIEFAANSTGRRGMRFVEAVGVSPFNTVYQMAINGGVHRMATRWSGPLLAGNKVKLQVFQESGGALNLNINGSRFSVRKVEELA